MKLTIVYKAGEAAFKRLPWILMEKQPLCTQHPHCILGHWHLCSPHSALTGRYCFTGWRNSPDWGSHTCKRKFSNCSWSSDWYDCRVCPHWAVMLGFGDRRRLWEWRARLRPGSPVAWGEWQWPHSASTCSVGLQGRLMLLSCSYLSPLPE